eukprot:3933425-Rhodomonas_salina.1
MEWARSPFAGYDHTPKSNTGNSIFSTLCTVTRNAVSCVWGCSAAWSRVICERDWQPAALEAEVQ